MIQLKGKNIVITGASSGIGESLAYKVAREGARPILLARSVEKLKDICRSLNETYGADSIWFQLDVGNRGDIGRVFKQIEQTVGTIDILVNSAGFGIYEYVADADLADYEEMFSVNVLGTIACTKAVLPQMIGRNSGHIINIASQAGKLATPKSSGYSATKFAVLGFSNSLRLELIETDIHISTVNPGPIDTNFFERADQSGTYQQKAKKMMMSTDYVAGKIVRLMQHPKRELNLPRWMNIGSAIYNLIPGFVEKIAGKKFNMK